MQFDIISFAGALLFFTISTYHLDIITTAQSYINYDIALPDNFVVSKTTKFHIQLFVVDAFFSFIAIFLIDSILTLNIYLATQLAIIFVARLAIYNKTTYHFASWFSAILSIINAIAIFLISWYF